jgi:hypothetical protein
VQLYILACDFVVSEATDSLDWAQNEEEESTDEGETDEAGAEEEDATAKSSVLVAIKAKTGWYDHSTRLRTRHRTCAISKSIMLYHSHAMCGHVCVRVCVCVCEGTWRLSP